MKELTKNDKLTIIDTLFNLKYSVLYFNFQYTDTKLVNILNLYNVITDQEDFLKIMNNNQILSTDKVKIIDKVINNLNFL